MTEAELKKLQDAQKKRPGAGRVTLSKMTGVSEDKARAFLKGAVKMSEVKDVSPMIKKGKTLSDFRAIYDKSTIVPAKVKAGLKDLGASGWDYEALFSKAIGVSLSDLAMFRDQFADHVVSLKEGRRIWAGSVCVAKQMRDML